MLNIQGRGGEDKAICNAPILDSSCSRIICLCLLSYTQRSDTTDLDVHTCSCAGNLFFLYIFDGVCRGGGDSKTQWSQVGPQKRQQQRGFEMTGGDDITEPPNHLHHRSCMLSTVSVCVHMCLFLIYFSVYLHLCPSLVSSLSTSRGACVRLCGD